MNGKSVRNFRQSQSSVSFSASAAQPSVKKFPLYLKFPCSAELVLDTEAAEWGGAHKGRRKLHFHTTDGGVYGRDYTLTVDLPAMGSFLLRLTPEAPNPDAARISANKAMAQKRRTARAKNSNK